MKINNVSRILTVMLGLTLLCQGAWAQGIQFKDYKKCTLNEVLKEAQTEKKYVFVDIWTPWCGVCKMIDRFIFPRKDVGEWFNKNCVNLSFDAENPAWVETGKNFNATSYPTMLILDNKGKVVWNIDNLGVPMEQDLTAEKAPVANRLLLQAQKAIALDTCTDAQLTEAANWQFICKEVPAFDTKIFSRLVSLKDTLLKLYPQEFRRVVNESLGSASANMTLSINHHPARNEHKMEQYRQAVKALALPNQGTQLLDMELTVAARLGEWNRVMQMAKDSQADMTPLLYGMMAEEMANGCKDKSLLKEAATLAQKAFAMKMNERHKKYVTSAYNQLVDAAGLPASQKK